MSVRACLCLQGCLYPGSAKADGREPKTGSGRVFNSKLGCIATPGSKCMAMYAATSKVVNSAQGSSCKLKFVHAIPYSPVREVEREREREEDIET